MTKEQIQNYEYFKDHLSNIKRFRKDLPFGIQMYGCGSSDPKITFTLDKIHRDMYNDVIKALNTANDRVQKLLDKL